MVRSTLPPSMVASPETASHTQTGRYSASTWICFKTLFRASTYLRTLSMSIGVLTPKFTTNITAYHLSTKRQMLQPLLANHGLAREIKSFLTSSTRIGTPHAFLHLYNFFYQSRVIESEINLSLIIGYFFFFQSAINLGSSNPKSAYSSAIFFPSINWGGSLSQVLVCLSSLSPRQLFLGCLRAFCPELIRDTCLIRIRSM